MSAYGHQLENMYSTRSLSDGSEMSSSYVLQSGFYITTFAATIFIAGFAAIGLLLITLLVSLALMLQSCQNNNGGIIELRNINDDYSYCKVYSLHAKLNKLEELDVPNICKDLAVQYIKGGQYSRDLDLTKSLIEDYFNGVRPSDDGLDVVLIDIDGIFPLNPHSSNLFQRAEDEDSTKENEYFARQRNVIQKKGLRIKSIISSHMDVLTVTDTGIRKFLLPDPICDMFEQQRRA